MCARNCVLIRRYSVQNKSNFYVTTPIYYVNATPHIGHLYSSVLADAIQRWHSITNPRNSIIFATGTDEHGAKIQQAAIKNKVDLPNYCSSVSERYRKLSDTFSVGYTDFIRTTEEAHENSVKHFWREILKNGHIYSSNYRGWYCISDETFLTESQLKEQTVNGQKTLMSAESGHPVEWTEEQNYMFKLASFQDDLIYWLTTNEDVVRPKKFQKILLDWIRSEELPDVSISRPSVRVHWGVKVPQDDTQTVYVWLDALVNYLTVAGYPDILGERFRRTWPPDVHVIGKDILKFHGVYWPAFLMAAKLEPPRGLLCHSHWTVDDEKMSKSKNNVVCPFDRSEMYTSDGLRYFLLREGVAHSDGNYTDTKVIRVLNSELADTFGNLLSRSCGVVLNPNQAFPAIDPEAFRRISISDATIKLMESVTALPDECSRHYDDFNFYKTADSVMGTLHKANLFFETSKPWILKKNPDTLKDLDVVLHLTLETLRICAIILQPVTPNLSRNLLNKINVPAEERSWDYAKKKSWDDFDFKSRHLSPEKSVLFKRILLPKDNAKIRN